VAHISRRELKTDEFRDSLESGYEFLSEHKRTIWQVAIIVVVAACAVFAWRYYTSRQSAQAGAAYADAIQIYNTPVQGSTQAPMPGQETFPSDAAKYQAAEKALGKVATQYGGTRYGQMARYYAAVSLEHVGNYKDAVNWLQPMTRRGDAHFQALAKFELAHVYEKMGKPQQAVTLYQQLLKNPSVFVPKPLVLLALGDHYQTLKNTTEAVKYYDQIKSEYPNTGLADQANQRLQMLGKT
jgi:predicted negative regulator of RcsB-dependent stress response